MPKVPLFEPKSRPAALDSSGAHVRAHQVSVWVAKLPDNERGSHSNVVVDNLVSMNSRADGFNVHGSVAGLTLQVGARQRRACARVPEYFLRVPYTHRTGGSKTRATTASACGVLE